MNSAVIYGSRHGNTHQVAEAIASVLRSRGGVRLLSTEEAPGLSLHGIDLVIVGGPTEGHGLTPAVAQCLELLESKGVRGMSAAAFDTRLRWPRMLSGSAAAAIADRLRQSGAQVVGPEGSFLVTMKPKLRAGELDRARVGPGASWGGWHRRRPRLGPDGMPPAGRRPS
jgi:flavodoxin